MNDQNYTGLKDEPSEEAMVQRKMYQCNNCYILIFFVTFCVGKVDAKCLRIKNLFFNLHDVMKTVGGAKIP